MLVLAHAGHWLVQLIYLVPLLVLVGVILAGRASATAARRRTSRCVPTATSED